MDFQEMMNEFLYEFQDSAIYVLSVLPVTEKRRKGINSKILKYNQLVRCFCADNSLVYLDLHSMFFQKDEMDNALTTDGIHLKNEAYALWKQCLKQYLE